MLLLEAVMNEGAAVVVDCCLLLRVFLIREGRALNILINLYFILIVIHIRARLLLRGGGHSPSLIVLVRVLHDAKKGIEI